MRQKEKETRGYVDKMTMRQKEKETRGYVDKMTMRQKEKETRGYVDKMTMRQDIGGDNWNVDREANQRDVRTSCIKDKQFGGQEDFRSGKKRMEGLEEKETRERRDPAIGDTKKTRL
jgi:hypothetical protein